MRRLWHSQTRTVYNKYFRLHIERFVLSDVFERAKEKKGGTDMLSGEQMKRQYEELTSRAREIANGYGIVKAYIAAQNPVVGTCLGKAPDEGVMQYKIRLIGISQAIDMPADILAELIYNYIIVLDNIVVTTRAYNGTARKILIDINKRPMYLAKYIVRDGDAIKGYVLEKFGGKTQILKASQVKAAIQQQQVCIINVKVNAGDRFDNLGDIPSVSKQEVYAKTGVQL